MYICEIEIEKIARVGESLGLSGTELHTFIKEQQDIARNERAAERDRIKEEKELAELKLNAERVKLEVQENVHANHTPVMQYVLPNFRDLCVGKIIWMFIYIDLKGMLRLSHGQNMFGLLISVLF